MKENNSMLPFTEKKVVVETVCPRCGVIVERVLEKRYTDSQDAWKVGRFFVISCDDRRCKTTVTDIDIARAENYYQKGDK